MFIDTATIDIRSGRGGNGAVSFRRDKNTPKGGPDGGDGGDGGDVVIAAARNLTTLMDFRYKRDYAAGNGRPGTGGNRNGKFGEPVTIMVPVGTLVFDERDGRQIADLTHDGQRVVLARGGKGGKGNMNFATPSDQAPRHAEEGGAAREKTIRLELKLLADVGLVGFPNAGKSTLISRISAARPKIGDYPFTTLIPNLGIVSVEQGVSFVVADIPGLIEGASQGKGLGFEFLRHVERSGLLCFLIDGTSDDPERDFGTLLTELGKYNPEMLWKPRIVCITKVDALDEDRRAELAALRIDGGEPMLISSVSGVSIDTLVRRMQTELERERARQAEGDESGGMT